MFRIYGKKQMAVSAVSMMLVAAVFLTAFSGASAAADTTQRKLPIYAVGRADDDKVISISFDAACPAG